jgi:branched-subunit amino acid transport protein AzlD
MRLELVLLAVTVGLATWAFRFVPTKLNLSRTDADGLLRRFLIATGPAAIATLFTASVLPMIELDLGGDAPLVLGIGAVVAVYLVRPSVVLSTLAGALAYGLAVFWLG